MLSNHGQSMFEYLAPRRRGGGAAANQATAAATAAGGVTAAAGHNPQGPSKPANDGYKDMVY